MSWDWDWARYPDKHNAPLTHTHTVWVAPWRSAGHFNHWEDNEKSTLKQITAASNLQASLWMFVCVCVEVKVCEKHSNDLATLSCSARYKAVDCSWTIIMLFGWSPHRNTQLSKLGTVKFICIWHYRVIQIVYHHMLYTL